LNLAKQPIGHVLHQLGHLGREDLSEVDKVVLFLIHIRKVHNNLQK